MKADAVGSKVGVVEIKVTFKNTGRRDASLLVLDLIIFSTRVHSNTFYTGDGNSSKENS